MKYLLATIAAVLLIAGPAEAAPYLSKSQAHRVAKKNVRDLYQNVNDGVSWSLDPTYACDRVRRNKVECGYSIEMSSGVICSDAIRLTKHYDGWVSISFPYEVDCV